MLTATETLPFSVVLQDFFCQRLMSQRNASPRTITSYRDTFRLLLAFFDQHVRKTPTSMTLADLDAPSVLRFLDRLESERGNCPRTRNVRLAAIRSFAHYAALRDPTSLPSLQRVLAIPIKRFDRRVLGSLTREEMQAVMTASDTSSWSGRRDRVLFAILYNTGARVSEAVGLDVADLQIAAGGSILIRGKGRKERRVPLWKSTRSLLKSWLREIGNDGPLLPNGRGTRMTRSGVASRLRETMKLALARCPSLRNQRISPHTIRHTTAMHLLQAGVDLSVIAIWLGHESITTTHQYLEADLKLKERALGKLDDPRNARLRLPVRDSLLRFLDEL